VAYEQGRLSIMRVSSCSFTGQYQALRGVFQQYIKQITTEENSNGEGEVEPLFSSESDWSELVL
jgi:hypothetical protein